MNIIKNSPRPMNIADPSTSIGSRSVKMNADIPIMINVMPTIIRVFVAVCAPPAVAPPLIAAAPPAATKTTS